MDSLHAFQLQIGQEAQGQSEKGLQQGAVVASAATTTISTHFAAFLATLPNLDKEE
jgi:hypothetical protein